MKSSLYLKFTKDTLIVCIDDEVDNQVILPLEELNEKNCAKIFALMIDKKSTLEYLCIRDTHVTKEMDTMETTVLMNCFNFLRELGNKISSTHKNRKCEVSTIDLQDLAEVYQKAFLTSIKGVTFSKLDDLINIDAKAIKDFFDNNEFTTKITIVPQYITNKNVDLLIEIIKNSRDKTIKIETDYLTYYDEIKSILKIIRSLNICHDKVRAFEISLSKKEEAKGGGVKKQQALIYQEIKKNFVMADIIINEETDRDEKIYERNAHLKKLCQKLGLIQAVPQFIKDFPDAKQELVEYLEKHLPKEHLMNYVKPDSPKNLEIFLNLFQNNKPKILCAITQKIKGFEKKIQPEIIQNDNYDDDQINRCLKNAELEHKNESKLGKRSAQQYLESHNQEDEQEPKKPIKFEGDDVGFNNFDADSFKQSQDDMREIIGETN